ncbi:MAG: polysaccharide biosynthesis/export family protein [Archangiaceae bacterium]|nr:polysaccharide biosynthesis/export family protein [Archangiaceae bacterium]
MVRSSLLLLLVLGAACRTPKPRDTGTVVDTAEVNPAEVRGTASTLGSGDLLEVRVYQEADLSGVFRVSPEGTIDYPLCGKVSVLNMSSSKAADAVTGCLKNGFLKSPQVTVLVREYTSKKVFVLGEITKPGTFPYEENMSIIQAVTLAGGFTKLASKNGTSVTRLVEGQETRVRVPVADIELGRQKNFQLQPGDIVFVPESFF